MADINEVSSGMADCKRAQHRLWIACNLFEIGAFRHWATEARTVRSRFCLKPLSGRI
jgi:hypothetical protein